MLVSPLLGPAVLLIFCIFAYLISKEWCISVVLIFIFLILLFMCLRVICVSFPSNCLCTLFACFFYWVIYYQIVGVYCLLVCDMSCKYLSQLVIFLLLLLIVVFTIKIIKIFYVVEFINLLIYSFCVLFK